MGTCYDWRGKPFDCGGGDSHGPPDQNINPPDEGPRDCWNWNHTKKVPCGTNQNGFGSGDDLFTFLSGFGNQAFDQFFALSQAKTYNGSIMGILANALNMQSFGDMASNFAFDKTLGTVMLGNENNSFMHDVFANLGNFAKYGINSINGFGPGGNIYATIGYNQAKNVQDAGNTFSSFLAGLFGNDNAGGWQSDKGGWIGWNGWQQPIMG